MKLTKSQRLFIKAGRIAEELKQWKEGDGGCGNGDSKIDETLIWLWKHHHGEIFYQYPDTIKFLKKEYKKTIREAIRAYEDESILTYNEGYGDGLFDN